MLRAKLHSLSLTTGTHLPTNALDVPGSDSVAISCGRAAVSTVSTWPTLHPYAVTADVLNAALETVDQQLMSDGIRPGLPKWIAQPQTLC